MKHTKESCFAVAASFSTRDNFKKGANPQYQWLRRQGLLADACQHMIRLNRSLSNDEIAKIASNYSSRRQFKLTDQGAYMAAWRRGTLDSVCSHMDVKYRVLTDDELRALALKYTTRSEFASADSGAYQTATKRGILDEVCAHMEGQGTRRLSSDEILQIASKYRTRMDFKLGDFGAYTTAIRRGLIVEACAHMEYGATGFREDKPAVLYQFRIKSPDGLVLYKAGITNRTPKQRVLTMGINPGYEAELVGFVRFDSGRDAKIAEKRLHRKNSSRRYGGPPVMRNGNTELFTASVLEL